MNEITNWYEKPSRTEWLTHENDYISLDLKFGVVNIDGKPDKRFKSGWRTYPESYAYVTPILKIPKDTRYRVGQTWSLHIGLTIISNMIVTTIGLSEITLISVAIKNKIDNIIINGKCTLLYMGSVYIEGR